MSGYGEVHATTDEHRVKLTVHHGTALARPLATVHFGTVWEAEKLARIINDGYRPANVVDVHPGVVVCSNCHEPLTQTPLNVFYLNDHTCLAKNLTP